MPSTTLSSPHKAIAFGGRRGKWLDQVHDDSEMTGDFFRVMYAITRRLNRETFTTFAGDEDLAALAKVSTKTVQRARERAVERKHISQVFHGCKGTVITPLLAGERGQLVQVQGDEGGLKPGLKPGQPERGPPVESKGCAPNSQDSQDSHKYKKEKDLKNGNSRGASPPEKESKPFPADSPSDSKPLLGWRDRLDEPPLLTGEERAALGRLAALANANGSGATTEVSS